MKQPYSWNYTIRVKTKDGTYEYEKETLDNIDLLLEKHKDYEEVQAKHIIRCDKCKIELSEVFIQETPQRTYRLCKNCNNYYMKLMGNVNNYEKKKKR